MNRSVLLMVAIGGVILLVPLGIMLCITVAGTLMPPQNTAEMAHAVTEVSSDVNHTASLLGNSSILVFGGVVIVALILIFGIGGTFFINSHNNTVVKGDQVIHNEYRLAKVDGDLREWVGKARALIPGEPRDQ